MGVFADSLTSVRNTRKGAWTISKSFCYTELGYYSFRIWFCGFLQYAIK